MKLTKKQLKKAFTYCKNVIEETNDVKFFTYQNKIFIELPSGNNLQLSKSEIQYRAELQEESEKQKEI